MRERLLFLSARTHNSEDGDGWLRTRSILEIVLEKYDVDLLMYGYIHDGDLPETGQSLVVHQVKMSPPSRRAMLGALYKPASRIYPGNALKDMRKAIVGLCELNRYRHVFLSHNLPGTLLDIVQQLQPEVTLIADAFRPRSGKINARSGSQRAIIKPYEHINAAWVRRDIRKMLKRTGLLLAASEWDALLFKALSFEDAGKVHVVPHFIKLNEYENKGTMVKEKGVTLHWNMNTVQGKRAALLFQQHIIPSVQGKAPGTRFYMVSKEVPAELSELAEKDSNITVVDPAQDAADYIRRSKVVFAPLSEGIEARREVLEAWALRTPVVTTFRGSERLICEDKRNILTGKTMEEIVECIVALLHDQERGAIMADRAYQTLLKHYESSNIKDKVLSLV